MARAATNLSKQLFALTDGLLDFRITWNHATRDLQRGLEYRGGSNIRAGEFVRNAVAIRVSVATEALDGLHSVMLVEGIVGELAERNHTAGLMPRPNQQSGRGDGFGCDQALA